MELEPVINIDIPVTKIITLFLYGIGAICYFYQVICTLLITLFLYGIGAVSITNFSSTSILLHYSYMELEQFHRLVLRGYLYYYIIPIWNWSSSFFAVLITVFILLHYSYMELELYYIFYFCFELVFITLFLYGIGADI